MSNIENNGNNRSYGNNWSNGNNYSNGNHCSDGNNHSNGNNRSDGNNRSYGNHCSDGNNWSYGNNHSNGNNRSMFCFDCRGTHKCIFCYQKKGIAYMVFNQQLEEKQHKDFYEGLIKLLNGWLPYIINYQEMKNEGRHKEYKSDNKYVEEYIEDQYEPYTRQYHDARSRFERKNELIEYIKSKEYLDTEKSLEIFEKITGINVKK